MMSRAERLERQSRTRRVLGTLSRTLTCASIAGLVLAVATPAWAPMAPDPGFRQGWESGERDADRRFQLELQRRQFEHQQRMLWEQTAQMRGPSRDATLNNAVSECGNQVNLRTYAWDAPSGPRVEWWGAPDRVVRAFKDCLAGQGYR